MCAAGYASYDHSGSRLRNAVEPMKTITIAILAAATIILGACAHHDAAPASSYSSTTSTHGYSK